MSVDEQKRVKTAMIGRMATTGEKLKRYRRGAGLSQRALAARAGITQANISAIERDARKEPRATTLGKLAKALDIKPSDLLGDVENERLRA